MRIQLTENRAIHIRRNRLAALRLHEVLHWAQFEVFIGKEAEGVLKRRADFCDRQEMLSII